MDWIPVVPMIATFELALRYILPRNVRYRLFLRDIQPWHEHLLPFQSHLDVQAFLEADKVLRTYWRID